MPPTEARSVVAWELVDIGWTFVRSATPSWSGGGGALTGIDSAVGGFLSREFGFGAGT